MPEAKSIDAEDLTAKLQHRLSQAVRDYAQFRLAAQSTFSQLEARVRNQQEQLHENDRYIHALHAERDELKSAVASARADVEAFSGILAESEKKSSTLDQARDSQLWWLAKPFFNAARKFGPDVLFAGKDLPGRSFVYYLHTSPYRIYRGTSFALRGWILPPAGQTISAIRVRIDQSEFAAQLGIAEPEVVRAHSLSKEMTPGFQVDFSLTAKKHRFRLEVCLNHHEWVSVLNTWIWSS